MTLIAALTAIVIAAGLIFTHSSQSGNGRVAGTENHFTTLPPGSALPSSLDCASRVRHSRWEPRPENAKANRTVGIACTETGACPIWSKDLYVHASRVDGKFSGTTDEILQWGACKWGLDEDLLRARAAEESGWRQSTLGDRTSDSRLCASFGATAPCYQSYGILQIKASIGDGYPNTYPYSQNSTAFNVDYSSAWLRACLDGYDTWLNDESAGDRPYVPGDLWGCVGAWYSGKWHDRSAETYVNSIRKHLASKVWFERDF
jgi:autotransporter family porin